MKIKQIFLAVPLLFSLTACSCGNKIQHKHTALTDETPVLVSEVGVMETSSGFFKDKVSDRVFFATDKSLLNMESKDTLKDQASMLKGKHHLNVVVEGHCDERGTREYNLALGERRANAAKEFLCSSGVHCDSVSTVSYGKERPAIDGHDSEAWAQNRRAVTVVSTK
jgi:peptidoglycan-associated lipoprotein